MKPKLAAGVTWDFVQAAEREQRVGAVILTPLFFVCCLLTRVPRDREKVPSCAFSKAGS